MPYQDPETAAAERQSQVFQALWQRNSQQHPRTFASGLAGLGSTLVAALMMKDAGDRVTSTQNAAQQRRSDAYKNAAEAGGGAMNPVVAALLGNPETADTGAKIMAAEMSRSPARAARPQTVGNDKTGIYALNPDGTRGGQIIPPGRAPPATPAPDRELVPVVGPNGKPMWVPRAEAPGKEVFVKNAAGSGDTGLFPGKSPQAAALNYLVKTGKMTAEQAAQWAAGHVMQGPDGRVDFATPESAFAALSAAPPATTDTPSASMVPGAPPSASLAPPDPAQPAPDVAPNNPGIITLRAGQNTASKDQRTKADDSVAAVNDLTSVASDLMAAIGDGVNPLDREQVGRVTAARDRLVKGIGDASHIGVISPTESANIIKNIGDPTSLMSVTSHETGIFDQNKRLKGYLDETVANARATAKSRAIEYGMTPEQFEAKMARQGASGAGSGSNIYDEAAAKAAPVHITGDADYNALPSGTHFISPDGSGERVKP